MSESSRMEIIWGVTLLDEGFTSIPNLLIRNYRRLGMEHGEYGFISQLLSYKHDARDPYPSRELLAANLCCSTRQVDKWVKSLRTKGLLRTGRRRNVHNKQWDNTVYSLKPLLDSLLRLVGEQPLSAAAEEFEVIWDDESEPRVPEVRVGSVPEVRMGSVPEVRTKKKSKNNNIKRDRQIESAAAEVAAASAQISSSIESKEEPDDIYEALLRHVPEYIYVADNIRAGIGIVDEFYLMLQQPEFENIQSSEVVQIACERYYDRVCHVDVTTGDVYLKQSIEKPAGLFHTCYKESVKLWKARRNRSARELLKQSRPAK